jgi:muramoyltetrapeptide carboxypeptidase
MANPAVVVAAPSLSGSPGYTQPSGGHPVLYPPALRPGSLVRVIAPSGPFDRALFFRAMGWLAERYRVVWTRGALERSGYLAGADERRLHELDEALRDPEARAVIAVRGGFGATRISDRADFESLARYPKWCVGFSDFTALHIEAARVRVASLHAQNLIALGRADERARLDWLDALEHPLARRSFACLERLAPGGAIGPLFGGNLSLLFCAAAAGRLHLPEGCLLFLEEVNEAPYRIDRMLTGLISGGHLRSAAAICVGDLVGDGPAEPRRQAEALAVASQRLTGLGVPVVAGLPIGHGANNRPIQCGVPAWLNGEGPAELVVNPDPGEMPR